MKLIKRTFSCILAGALIVSLLSTDAKAAQAGVSIDEAVYVNLDYYGKTENINIVKGCDLNGNTAFKDYGFYDKITNMTNEDKPSILDDCVNWKLPQNTNRFYYECTPKSGTVTLPWDFDISYKLNGVPANAEKLAGASGLVEINIKAKPNKKASTYLKNNMLLMVETTVDMSDTTSVEAPGAQLQSVGNFKAVLFAGLPGEENNFTMRIGTKSFETTGIMMTMLPGTLDQLTDIKELKESKDTIEDSADAVYDSLNEILSTIQSTSKGLSQVKSGISSLDGARETISASKSGLYADADKSLADITSITKQISDLIPHLQNGQKMVSDVNTDVNAMVDTINSIKPYISSFKNSIGKIQEDTNDLCDIINKVEGYSDDRHDLIEDINDSIDTAEKDMQSMQSASRTLTTRLDSLKSDLSTLDTAMQAMPTQLDSVSENLANAAAAGLKTVTTAETVGVLNSELKSIIAAGEPMIDDLADVVDSTASVTDELNEICDNGDDLVGIARRTINLGDDYFDSMEAGLDTTEDLLNQANIIGDTAKDVLDKSKILIDNASSLNDTVNKYKDGAVTALKDTETLFGGFITGLTDTQVFLSSLEATFKASGDDLDEGTRQSLNGLIDLLQKSLKGIGSTSTVKNANDTIKKTYDDKMDEIEDDSNLLDMDAEAKPISFTSAKNPAPQSIQVIMRTKEISIDDNKSTGDLEKSKESSGFVSRITQVFVELWNKITSVFSK